MVRKQNSSEARRRNASIMAAHVRACDDSGLTHAAYCQRVGIGLRKLQYWKQKLKRESSDSVKFVELIPSKASERTSFQPAVFARSASQSLKVTVDGGRFIVDVPDDFAAETLARLVDVLERS